MRNTIQVTSYGLDKMLTIGQINTNLVEEAEYLLSVKFRQNSFSNCREVNKSTASGT